jgi:hypothetical protein
MTVFIIFDFVQEGSKLVKMGQNFPKKIFPPKSPNCIRFAWNSFLRPNVTNFTNSDPILDKIKKFWGLVIFEWRIRKNWSHGDRSTLQIPGREVLVDNVSNVHIFFKSNWKFVMNFFYSYPGLLKNMPL